MTNIILVVLAAAGVGLWAESCIRRCPSRLRDARAIPSHFVRKLAGGQQNAVIAWMERLANLRLWGGAQHNRGSATALRRGFRFFASLAQAVALILTGLMAREMSGGRRPQFLAAAVYLPNALGAGALMQYVSFDNVCWVLAVYFVVRLLPRLWVAVGAAAGLGMMAKYAMAFFAAAIFAGFLLTNARRYLASRWLLAGCSSSSGLRIWRGKHSINPFHLTSCARLMRAT